VYIIAHSTLDYATRPLVRESPGLCPLSLRVATTRQTDVPESTWVSLDPVRSSGDGTLTGDGRSVPSTATPAPIAQLWVPDPSYVGERVSYQLLLTYCVTIYSPIS
jgi:hypothetical protein